MQTQKGYHADPKRTELVVKSRFWCNKTAWVSVSLAFYTAIHVTQLSLEIEQTQRLTDSFGVNLPIFSSASKALIGYSGIDWRNRSNMATALSLAYCARMCSGF